MKVKLIRERESVSSFVIPLTLLLPSPPPPLIHSSPIALLTFTDLNLKQMFIVDAREEKFETFLF